MLPVRIEADGGAFGLPARHELYALGQLCFPLPDALPYGFKVGKLFFDVNVQEYRLPCSEYFSLGPLYDGS